jgi:hypothetical protein
MLVDLRTFRICSLQAKLIIAFYGNLIFELCFDNFSSAHSPLNPMSGAANL